MNNRIFSFPVIVVASIVLTSSSTFAEDRPGYYTDPDTGIVYRQVTRTVERPVVDTKIEQQEQTVFRPQTVQETRPETQTVFTPVTQYEVQAVVEGRWNPFRQPTVAYRSVPKTHWEARSQTVNRTATRTEWVPEKRTVDVPHRIMRMEREQKVDYEVVGRVAPPRANPTTGAEAIASRLRPLDSNTAVEPMRTAAAAYPPTVPRLASSSVGQLTSDPPRRSSRQRGMRGTNLYPSAPNGYGSVLPPTGTTGIATMPGFSLWR